ncbi:MAG: GNAT family N-acetyltransferase [Polyangiaceae bacterium]|nr:GNAT family N-acetyltransferase [Polyangiaceae bacterium]
MNIPELSTERLLLTIPAPTTARQLVSFVRKNREHFAPWDPPADPAIESADYWSRRLALSRREFKQGISCRFVLFPRGAPAADVIGMISLSSFVRGALQQATLGYKIAKKHEGRGLMREGLEEVIRYAFDELCLHRLSANYQPTNERSGALLRRLGFSVDGYARDYLFVGGGWRDHVLTSLVNPSWRPLPRD